MIFSRDSLCQMAQESSLWPAQGAWRPGVCGLGRAIGDDNGLGIEIAKPLAARFVARRRRERGATSHSG
jgi:hypothetical protein